MKLLFTCEVVIHSYCPLHLFISIIRISNEVTLTNFKIDLGAPFQQFYALHNYTINFFLAHNQKYSIVFCHCPVHFSNRQIEFL